MPVYKVNIDRKVVNWERFTRYIEAANPELAEVIADQLADHANRDCPDDAGPGNFDDELEDWQFNDLEEASETDLAMATEHELYNVGEEGEE